MSRNRSISKLSVTSRRMRSYSKSKTLANAIPYEDDILEIMEEYAEQLNHIFVAYASKGEPMSSNKLKSFKFIRLLKDAGVMSRHQNSISLPPKDSFFAGSFASTSNPNRHQRTLSVVDSDFIFSSLTGYPYFYCFLTKRHGIRGQIYD